VSSLIFKDQTNALPFPWNNSGLQCQPFLHLLARLSSPANQIQHFIDHYDIMESILLRITSGNLLGGQGGHGGVIDD
jgi:hypothetical protein